MTAKEGRQLRTTACELAVRMMSTQTFSSSRLMALCVFFENYIELGAHETDRVMHLLTSRKTQKLHVVSGGKLK